MILRCLLPALLLLTGVSTVASESYFLQILDQWDNQCNKTNAVNRTSCSAITNGDCRHNVECLRIALRNRLPQLSSVDNERLGSIAHDVEKIVCTKSPFFGDYSSHPEYKTEDRFAAAVVCADSMKADLSKCLKNLTSLYCSWKSEISGRNETIWSEAYNKLIWNIRSCVLHSVARCPADGASAKATYTEVFEAFKGPNGQWLQESSSASLAGISVLHMLPVFIVYHMY